MTRKAGYILITGLSVILAVLIFVGGLLIYNNIKTDESVENVEKKVITETKTINDLYDSAIKAAKINISDIVSFSYNSAKYVNYYSNAIAEKASDDKNTYVIKNTQNYIFTFITYKGVIKSVIMNDDGKVVDIVKDTTNKSIRYACKKDMKSIINDCIKYLDVKPFDIWVFQVTPLSDKYMVEVGSVKENAEPFGWNPILYVSYSTGNISKAS